MRPASESTSFGTSNTLAEPVRIKRPATRLRSTVDFKAANSAGTRCTSSRIARPGRSATKPAGSGTGLGLAVAQQIIQAHHGFIYAESQVGRGTSFFIYLPASTSAEIETVSRQSEPAGGSETILVLDDEPVLLHLLRDMLHPKGYHVLAAGSSRDALDYIEAVGDKIDLVISDNMMPDMTGRELAREIRTRYPEMRILVCSGFSPTRESELGEIDYVSSYVQKPYQRRDLLTRVRAALDAN